MFSESEGESEGRRRMGPRRRVRQQRATPMTVGELTAFNVGRRMARAQDRVVESLVVSSVRPTSYMTEEELEATKDLAWESFRRWWWQGWSQVMAEDL